MKLLIDSDAFCKLGIAGVLDDLAAQLGATLTEAGRLPALPHMLRRGKLRRLYGGANCDSLLTLANALRPVPDAPPEWLDALVHLDGVDPGEAQLFALAASQCLYVATGDKRALRALRGVPQLVDALDGRVVVMEAALLSACTTLGVDVVRLRVVPLGEADTMIRVCFSGNGDPRQGLLSYLEHTEQEMQPLTLWRST